MWPNSARISVVSGELGVWRLRFQLNLGKRGDVPAGLGVQRCFCLLRWHGLRGSGAARQRNRAGLRNLGARGSGQITATNRNAS